jgi:pimeloyl-ACP methyl ester carboxylesterase
VRSRFFDDVNGLRVHIIEAGFGGPDRPLVLLLHGFPELGYSWRKIMAPLADMGFHVVAPDQRGYGWTTRWDPRDLSSFRLFNIVRDAFALVAALGYQSVAMVAGHDFGAPVAAWCALLRPDVFRRVAIMSAPFAGTPARLDAGGQSSRKRRHDVVEELAMLSPPRKHYHWYYSTPSANADMMNCEEGVHDFLRAYFHVKSGDWAGNNPFPLKEWSAEELAKLPRYYVMDAASGMPATVAEAMPSRADIARCSWLPDSDLEVYSEAFRATGFQGGLNWYVARTSGEFDSEAELFAGKTIDVPTMFVAGARDWGVFQSPGSLERMRTSASTAMVGCHLIDVAGHWVQQERPSEVLGHFVRLLEA